MKSTLVVLCGETMDPADPRREAAFADQLIGHFRGGDAVRLRGRDRGTVLRLALRIHGCGRRDGHCSWLRSGLSKRWLGSIGLAPDRTGAGRSSASGAIEVRAQAPGEAPRRVALLFVLALLLCAFSIGWFQLFGSWLLFIEGHVDQRWVASRCQFRGSPRLTPLSSSFCAAGCRPLGEARRAKSSPRHRP